MPHVTIQKAQNHLVQLIQKALAGEEVVIAKGKVPLVKLVAVRNGNSERRIGADKGLIEIADDFDAPLDDFKEYIAHSFRRSTF